MREEKILWLFPLCSRRKTIDLHYFSISRSTNAEEWCIKAMIHKTEPLIQYCFFYSVIFVSLVPRFFFHSLISFVCLCRGQNWLRGFLEAWLHSNYFLWKHMFDFFDNHDECRKSCFFRQKIRSIFSPIWSILTLFNAKALFSALMSEFFTHFLSPSFKGFKDLCYPVCDY